MNTDSNAVAAYIRKMGEIDNIARHLQDFADDHGGKTPDAVTWESCADLNHVLFMLNQVAAYLCIDLTTEAA